MTDTQLTGERDQQVPAALVPTPYAKPVLRCLGLLRRLTRFTF